MLMADALTIDVTSLVKGSEELKKKLVFLTQQVDDVLTAGASDIATRAKVLAPVDLGGLRSSIAYDVTKPLEKHITVNVGYAAYVEFGTGVYAASAVGKLPADWQEFAAKFKGKKQVKGMMPQPYLFPAYEENRTKILDQVEAVLKTI